MQSKPSSDLSDISKVFEVDDTSPERMLSQVLKVVLGQVR